MHPIDRESVRKVRVKHAIPVEKQDIDCLGPPTEGLVQSFVPTTPGGERPVWRQVDHGDAELAGAIRTSIGGAGIRIDHSQACDLDRSEAHLQAWAFVPADDDRDHFIRSGQDRPFQAGACPGASPR